MKLAAQKSSATDAARAAFDRRDGARKPLKVSGTESFLMVCFRNGKGKFSAARAARGVGARIIGGIAKTI